MRTCCCCFTVRIGTLVLGILGTIGSFCNLIYLIIRYVQIKAAHDPNIQRINQAVFITLVVGTSVSLVVNLLLVIGVAKKNKCLMLPWIILAFIGTAFITQVAFLCFIFIFIHWYQAAARFFQFCITAIYCAVAWHFNRCVWSHYDEIGDKEARFTAGLPDTHEIDNNTSACEDTGVPI